MSTDHLQNILFTISLAGGSLAGLIGLACLPLGVIRAKHNHDKGLIELAKTCFGIMMLLAAICLVLYYTAVSSSRT